VGVDDDRVSRQFLQVPAQLRWNVLLFRRGTNIRREQRMQCRERLGGLLRYYHQEAA
jgi:hypothetical protein